MAEMKLLQRTGGLRMQKEEVDARITAMLANASDPVKALGVAIELYPLILAQLRSCQEASRVVREVPSSAAY